VLPQEVGLLLQPENERKQSIQRLRQSITTA
jgi:hypothetical protein